MTSFAPQSITSIQNSPLVIRSDSPQRIRPATCGANLRTNANVASLPSRSGATNSRQPDAYGVEATLPFHFGSSRSFSPCGTSAGFTVEWPVDHRPPVDGLEHPGGLGIVHAGRISEIHVLGRGLSGGGLLRQAPSHGLLVDTRRELRSDVQSILLVHT